jgi:hypothetical protein
MAKRTDYSKVSLKAKSPKSIRYNVQDFEVAVEISGRATVQSLWDYLLSKYLAEHGRHLVAPIDAIDARPIDKRVFELGRHEESVDLTKVNLGIPIRSFDMKPTPIPKNSEGFDIDEMPMWKPALKSEKGETKAETEKFAAAEMKRLKEMQERAERLKGKKK